MSWSRFRFGQARLPGGASSDANHTGQDLFTFHLGERANTRSWTYVVDSPGRIISRAGGAKLPGGVAFAYNLRMAMNDDGYDYLED